jgi:hypothetical protein
MTIPSGRASRLPKKLERRRWPFSSLFWTAYPRTSGKPPSNVRRVAQTCIFSACLRFPEGTAPRFPSVLRPVLEAARLDSPFSPMIAGVTNRCLRNPRSALECGSLLPLLLRPACWPRTGVPYLGRRGCERARRTKAAASCLSRTHPGRRRPRTNPPRKNS